MKKLLVSLTAGILAVNAAVSTVASAGSLLSYPKVYADSDYDGATIDREYVPADLEHAAYVSMTKEDYEDLIANPDSYNLEFIDSKPVITRNNIVKSLEDMDAPGLISVPIYAGCEVMKRLDGVFMAVNTRNEALSQLDDFFAGFSATTTAATTTATTTTTTATTTSAARTTAVTTTAVSTTPVGTTTTAVPTTAVSTTPVATTTTAVSTTALSTTPVATTTTAVPTTAVSTTPVATTTTAVSTTVLSTTPVATTSTTTAAVTSTTSAVTTTTTQTETGDSDTETKSLGDIDGNGIVDAVDASKVLAYYAQLATSQAESISEAVLKAADVNGDGFVDAVDASTILAYYAYASTETDNVLSLSEFLNKEE